MRAARLAVTLVLLALVWPVVLGAAWADHVDGAPRLASSLTYLAASRVCHQRPDRSFVTNGVRWPVCGRCAGLYVAAPIGALAAFATRRPTSQRTGLLMLAVAAVPSTATLVLEWAWPNAVTSMHRLGAALPLGAALALVLVAAARRSAQVDRVH